MPGEWNGQRTRGWSLLQELHKWRKRHSPKGQRHSPLFHEIQYGTWALLPRGVVDGRGEPEDDGRDEGELVSASENCIGLDSSSTSLKHQLPLHPSGRQRHTQATNDQGNGRQFG